MGTYRIITNMAVIDFEKTSKRMRIIFINPGYSTQEILSPKFKKHLIYPLLGVYLPNAAQYFQRPKRGLLKTHQDFRINLSYNQSEDWIHFKIIFILLIFVV
jgi:hypothetical protein